MKKVLYILTQCTWGFLPACAAKRKNEQVSYFSFFTERWANALGERVTGEPSMENLVID